MQKALGTMATLDVGSPEAQLLLSCSRAALDPAAAERLRRLLTSDLDWACVDQVAQTHRVKPLLYNALSTVEPSVVPPAFMSALREHFHGSARRNLALTHHLLSLLQLFRANAVRVIPFKGPVLAAGAYRSLALRPFFDLDVLVDGSDVQQARRLLESRGYSARGYQADWEQNLENSIGVAVDLHQAIASSYEPTFFSFDELWDRLKPVSIGGGTVDALAPEDLLLVQCIQFVKDCRERRQRLIQLCDVAEVLRSLPQLDLGTVLQRAGSVYASRIPLLVLLLAHRLLDAPLPAAVLDRAADDPSVNSLAAYVSAQLLRLESAQSVDQRPDMGLWHEDWRFCLRLQERQRDKSRYLWLRTRNLLRLAVTPSLKDREFFPLPGRLGFLHFFVRPIRVISEGMLRSRFGGESHRSRSAD
jgi:hypothetical protein